MEGRNTFSYNSLKHTNRHTSPTQYLVAANTQVCAVKQAHAHTHILSHTHSHTNRFAGSSIRGDRAIQVQLASHNVTPLT